MDQEFSKIDQWEEFSALVEEHIKVYVRPQYGDFPDKTAKKWTQEKIQAKLESYVDRIGKSSRGPEDAARDALKIAHLGNYLYWLIITGSAQGRGKP